MGDGSGSGRHETWDGPAEEIEPIYVSELREALAEHGMTDRAMQDEYMKQQTENALKAARESGMKPRPHESPPSE